MLERLGNLWDVHADGATICITTNGYINSSGRCTMGRGIAFQATQRFPDISRLLADRIQSNGLHVEYFAEKRLIAFPVKHVWWQHADHELICQSALELLTVASTNKLDRVYLPRPGCGNGWLNWADIKPAISSILDDRFVVMNFGA